MGTYIDFSSNSIMEKLNNLTDLNTYWDDVRELCNPYPDDHTLKKWERLSEHRYQELLKENYDTLTDAQRKSCDSTQLLNMSVQGIGDFEFFDMVYNEELKKWTYNGKIIEIDWEV